MIQHQAASKVTQNSAVRSWQIDKRMRWFHQEKNEKLRKDKKTSSEERNGLLRTVKHLGRPYGKKAGLSLSKFGGNQDTLHKIIGGKLSARNFESQVNEIHARVSVLNQFTELGRPYT